MPNQKCTIVLITALIVCLGTSLSPSTWNNQTTTYTQASTSSLPTIEWNTTFGLGYYNTAYQIIQTPDDGYAVAGMYGPKGSGLNSALVKYDKNGNLLWNQTYDIRFYNYPATGLLQTEEGGYAIVGNYVKEILMLIKTDSEGNSQWNQTYPDINCLAWGLTQTRDGGYLVAGGRSDNWGVLVKTTASGEMQWSKTYPVKGFHAAVQANDGNYVAVGGNKIIKVDAQGNILWNKELPPILPSDPEQYRYSHTYMDAMIKTTDGGYALSGRALNENNHGEETILALIIKTDASGTIQWNKTYGESGQVWPYSLIQTSDDGYALAGIASKDMILIKTDANGNEQWNQTFGNSPDTETAFSVIETSDGGFALAGKIKEGTTFSSGYFYIAKITTDSPSASPSTGTDVNSILPKVAALVSIVAVCILLIVLVRKYRRHCVAS